jgi:hypothetical protein
MELRAFQNTLEPQRARRLQRIQNLWMNLS